MSIMKKFLISLLVISFGLCAYAANWERISDKIYLDTSGIASNGKSVFSFWTKELNDGGTDFILAESKYSQKVWYDLVRYSIDCSARKFKIDEVLIYGLQNNLIADDTSAAGGWNSIPPQSIAEDYLELVCKHGSQITPSEPAEKKDPQKVTTPGGLSFTVVDPNTLQNGQNKNNAPQQVKKTVNPADWDSYMKNLQAKISSNWQPPESETSLKTTLIFRISKDGTLITLSEFNGSGNQEFDDAASDAVKKSVPFPVLPDGVQSKGIDVQLTFDKTVHGFILSGK